MVIVNDLEQFRHRDRYIYKFRMIGHLLVTHGANDQTWQASTIRRIK